MGSTWVCGLILPCGTHKGSVGQRVAVPYHGGLGVVCVLVGRVPSVSPSPPQPRAAASLCKRPSLLFSPACGEGISAELFRLNNAELLNLRRFQPAEAQRAFSLRRRQSAPGCCQMDAIGGRTRGFLGVEEDEEGKLFFLGRSQRTYCKGASKRAYSVCASVQALAGCGDLCVPRQVPVLAGPLHFWVSPGNHGVCSPTCWPALQPQRALPSTLGWVGALPRGSCP